jgi:DNA-binding MarR family transcriptional regulator
VSARVLAAVLAQPDMTPSQLADRLAVRDDELEEAVRRMLAGGRIISDAECIACISEQHVLSGRIDT